MNKTTKNIAMLVALVLLTSCGNYFEQKSEDDSNSFKDDLTVAPQFSTVKKKIFQKNCTICHQQYDNYPSVVADLGKIQAAINSDRMPKNAPPLSVDQKSLLKRWIAAGVPNSGQQPIPVPPSDDLQPTWASLSIKVFVPKCIFCHNPQGQARFLDLSSRQAVFEARYQDFGGPHLIDFDQPDQSYLLEVIRDPEEPMPPIWSNIQPLSQDEIKNIEQWIARGLP